MSEVSMRPVFAVLFVCFSAVSAEAQSSKVLQIVDDLGKGVKSEVWKLTRSDPPQRTRLGVTGDDGLLSVAESCESGERLRAEPISTAVYNAQNLECPITKSPTQLLITRVEYVLNLIANAIRAETLDKEALAALLYNEVYVRIAASDAEKAATYKLKTIQLIGGHLGVASPLMLDPAQGKHGVRVMTPSMREAIKLFQYTSHLDDTGMIDFSTLSTAAGISTITPYLLKKDVVKQ